MDTFTGVSRLLRAAGSDAQLLPLGLPPCFSFRLQLNPAPLPASNQQDCTACAARLSIAQVSGAC